MIEIQIIYPDNPDTDMKKTVGWECMYITMGTAVYGYISYEFLGLSEVVKKVQ